MNLVRFNYMKRMPPEAGKMAQWVRCMFHKHNDQHADLQHPHKCWVEARVCLRCRCLRGGDRLSRGSWLHRPAELLILGSSKSLTSTCTHIYTRVPIYMLIHTLIHMQIHMHPYTCKYTHSYTRKYTYTKEKRTQGKMNLYTIWVRKYRICVTESAPFNLETEMLIWSKVRAVWMSRFLPPPKRIQDGNEVKNYRKFLIELKYTVKG